MRIDTSNRTTGVGRGNAAGRSGSGVAFVPAGGDAPARGVGGAPAQAMTGIDAILALQTADGPLTGRKKAMRRGASLLDSLEDLRADLLIGRIDAGRLDRMAAVLSEARERSLPGLDALLDDIELRVRVELAKVGRYPAG